jgi:hypothetical protein
MFWQLMLLIPWKGNFSFSSFFLYPILVHHNDDLYVKCQSHSKGMLLLCLEILFQAF